MSVLSVQYLGHVLSKNGVQIDRDKIQAVLDWPLPAKVKGLRGFLGSTGYYRKFVKDYGLIADIPLELLKQKIVTAHILSLPKFLGLLWSSVMHRAVV